MAGRPIEKEDDGKDGASYVKELFALYGAVEFVVKDAGDEREMGKEQKDEVVFREDEGGVDEDEEGGCFDGVFVGKRFGS